MKESVLLLTACVNPNGMDFTKLQDADERLRQYKVALQWYLDNTNIRIVFVENSGSDLTDYYKDYIDKGRLEVLTFLGNDYDRSLGKGYGEGKIVEYGLKNSEWLNNASHIIKITGRLICKNVNQMISAYNKRNTIYLCAEAELDDVMRCKSQVFVVTPLFLKDYFLPGVNKLDDSKHYWFEHLLYDVSLVWKRDGYCLRDMWIPIKLEGISGSSGSVISTSSFMQIGGFYLHYILHRFGYYGPLSFWNYWLH